MIQTHLYIFQEVLDCFTFWMWWLLQSCNKYLFRKKGQLHLRFTSGCLIGTLRKIDSTDMVSLGHRLMVRKTVGTLLSLRSLSDGLVTKLLRETCKGICFMANLWGNLNYSFRYLGMHRAAFGFKLSPIMTIH